MAKNSHKMKMASKRHAANITKRGEVPATLTPKEDQNAVGPLLIGFFVFVVCGSAVFQLLNSAFHQ